MKKRLLVLTAACLCSLNAMSQQGSRLIGEGLRVYTGGFINPVDTATSTYTSGAYDALEDMWIPNQTVRGAYSMTSYYLTTRTTNTFNSQQQLSEKLEEQYDTITATYNPVTKDFYHYNSNGYVDTITGQFYSSGSFNTQVQFIYTYDGLNRLIDLLMLYNSGSGLENFSRERTSYNSSGQKDTTTRLLWDNTTMTWDPDMRTTFYYNTPNPIAQVIAQFNGTTWTEIDSLINTLDANSNILTQLRKVLQGGVFVNSSNQINTYDANNNLLTSIAQFFSGGVFVNFSQTTNAYNTFNQPTQTTVLRWDPATSTFTWQNGSTLRAFTYETVITGIKGTVMQKDAIFLYPMPASNKLTIDLKGTDMKDATFVLFDMTGKLTGRWNASTATQQQTLDISNIPPGTYLLKVVGDNGMLSQKVNIVR